MKALIILAAILLSGCATKDPFEGAQWAVTDDDFIALCTEGNRCFTPSQSDREYFESLMCKP